MDSLQSSRPYASTAYKRRARIGFETFLSGKGDGEAPLAREELNRAFQKNLD